MNFTQSIFRKSIFFMALIPVFALWGFWVTYFTRPPETLSGYDHLHGFAMLAWTLMLILQSFLIRASQRGLHRVMGRLSYLLAPLVIVSTIMLANYRINVRGITDEGLYILGLQTFILIQFAFFYSMAIYYRKNPDVHARWMICTALTLLDPIFARIILVNFIPVPIETGIAQYFTYSGIVLIVLFMIFKDWKAHQRRDVFVPALIVLVVTQLLSLFTLKMPVWEAFAEWFKALPLS